MDRALPPLASALTFEDVVAVEDCLDAAAAWQRGEMPWHVAAGVGTIRDWRGQVSSPYSRYVAYRVTPPTDPRRQALAALIDVIVRQLGYRVTRQGVFIASEMRENDAGWATADLKARTI